MGRFGMRALLSSILTVIPLASPGAGAVVQTVPNLRPKAPFQARIGFADSGQGTALRFSIATMNLGDHAFEIIGVPRPGETDLTAVQCDTFAGRACLHHQEVGRLRYHDVHYHWHLEGYALYELRAFAADGLPDMTPAGLVATGGKASFCLLDYEHADPTKPRRHVGPVYIDDPQVYNGCLPFWQGISPGWSDVYGYHLYGQQIVIDGVPDGEYALVVTVDPDGMLLETTHDDNVNFARVSIEQDGTAARVAG